MKKQNITPTKSRGLGNVLPFLNTSSFSKYHSTVDETVETETIDNIEYPVFTFYSPVTDVSLSLSASQQHIYPVVQEPQQTVYESVVTCTLTETVSGDPCASIDIFVYDEYYDYTLEKFVKTLIGNIETNSSGVATYTFSSPNSGVHHLTFKTVKQSNYNGTSSTVDIDVLFATTLTLAPNPTTVSETGHTQLVATLSFNNQGVTTGIAGETISLKKGNETLLTGVTNNEGKVYFSVTKAMLEGGVTTTAVPGYAIPGYAIPGNTQ